MQMNYLFIVVTLIFVAFIAILLKSWKAHVAVSEWKTAYRQESETFSLPVLSSARSELGKVSRMRTLGKARADCPLDALGMDFADSTSSDIEMRLEQAFELYVRKRISIATYISIVTSQHEALRDRLVELNGFIPDAISDPASIEAEKAAVLEAIEAVVWCLDWANRIENAEARDAA